MGLKRKSTIIFIALSFILAAACYYYFGIYHSVRDVHAASDYIGFPTAESLFTHAELIKWLNRLGCTRHLQIQS